MTNAQIVQAARDILPLLRELLGEKAAEVEAQLRRLLDDPRGAEKNADRMLELLASYPATRRWMKEHTGSTRSVRKGLPTGHAARPPAAPAPPAAAAPSVPPPRPAPKDPYDVIQIHFATDRRPSGSVAPKQFFTGEQQPDGCMTYGTCEVSIPATHEKGELEGPSWLRLEFREDPARHVVLLTVKTLESGAFFSSVGNQADQGLVFVHGFNVTFEDAARRMAQIARDLKFGGVPILYSWPSRGAASKKAYIEDARTNEWSIPHLRQFLIDLMDRTGIRTFHMIAHSMGTRAVTRALQMLALEGRLGVKFEEVVLTAPDIDTAVFKELAPTFLATARRVTLYASNDDKALAFSKRIHGASRVGDAGEQILVLNGMDSVDATGIDTSFLCHSYFGSVRSVLSDVYYLLRGVPAKDRSELETVASPTGTHFRFVP